MVILETGSELLLGCLLSPTLFNNLLETIMTDALDGNKGSVSNGCRIFINFRFKVGTVVNAEEEEEADDILPVWI